MNPEKTNFDNGPAPQEQQGPIKPESGADISQRRDEIALRAAEIPVFKDIVQNFPNNKIEAIRCIRVALRKHFPEIDQIPEEKHEPEVPGSLRLKNPLGGCPSNEFLIAREIVKLLSK